MQSLAWAGYFRLSAAVQSDGIRLLRLPDWDGEVLVRRVVLTLSALTATGLVLTACGERSRPSPWADPPIPTIPQKVEGGQAVTRYWPLTGFKVRSTKTAKLDHRVLVAKMDNTVCQPTAGRPEQGRHGR